MTTAHPSHSPDRTVIGRYRVDRAVGQGGMSQTWRCTLAGMGGFRKLVLVKMLDPGRAADPEYVTMFLDGARLSARLSHPNIAQVFEVGEQDGVPWLAMEYVAGPNLAMISHRLRRGGRRHYGHIGRLMADVARGLDHAHRLRDDHGRPLGIIHRDVSLGNAVVSPEGVARLIDFGIAWSRTKSNQTADGVLKGKLHYMAPEQLEGDVDHRVDIYQAGVCLYWLLTGRPPFHHRDPVRLWRQRLEGNPALPSSLRPDVPVALERVVMRALHRSPERRFATAGELADALVAAVQTPGPWRSTPSEVGPWVRSLFDAPAWEDFRTCSVEFQDTDAELDRDALAWSSDPAGPAVDALRVEVYEPDSEDSLRVPISGRGRRLDDDAPIEHLRALTSAEAPRPRPAAAPEQRWPLLVAAVGGAGLSLLAVGFGLWWLG